MISISSIPGYNEEAKRRGATQVVHKDFEDLERFSDQVIDEIEDLVVSA